VLLQASGFHFPAGVGNATATWGKPMEKHRYLIDVPDGREDEAVKAWSTNCPEKLSDETARLGPGHTEALRRGVVSEHGGGADTDLRYGAFPLPNRRSSLPTRVGAHGRRADRSA
jgi:hypothetical protein